MAISSYPTPADAGVLCVILANTAISISIVKELVRSILQVIGIHFESSSDEFSVEPSNSSAVVCRRIPSESYMEDFRSKTPTILYDSIFISDCECSICLAEFKANAEINHLSCGHVFHKLCLEKWLKYWNTTCPLCRNYMMMPQEIEEDATCPIICLGSY
ncbi:hypothetical protein ACJIZ3_007518 [Penstemon smallii]|uniref:RING-type domain-containing protein n=1 Tax=Penstemon smallii TaxID=265156 RepID=A0ABD3SB24_9LAMI